VQKPQSFSTTSYEDDEIWSATVMAKTTLKPCCEKALKAQIKHIRNNYASFPVIKDIPCPVCRQIIPVRVYERPAEANP
jgi:hypothetical protein